MKTIEIPESIFDRICYALTDYEDAEAAQDEKRGEALYFELVEIMNDIAEYIN